MPITFSSNSRTQNLNQKRKRTTHTVARATIIDLNGPGRLRIANVLAIFGFSDSTLRNRMAHDRFPKPDGRDGFPFWNTTTIREHLAKINASK